MRIWPPSGLGRVLVIDDSRAMRAILKRLLADRGFEVAEAEHGAAALAFLRAGPQPDLCLVDWNMPEMTGVEFVREVRLDRRFDEMQIMVVSVESDMDRLREALDSGADEYLMKPFDEVALVQKLQLMGVNT